MARIMYTDMSGQERSVPIGNDAPVVSIGRATDCTIRSNRKSVSRRHAEFRFANGQFEIIDLNSSNGTYLIINEERKPVLGREYLAHNDEVWCGDFILRFFEEDSATADQYGEEATFGAPRSQPPAFGGPPQSSFGGSNGQFGQQGGHDQQDNQSQAPWGNQQAGPRFSTPSSQPPPQQSALDPPALGEPQFGSGQFGNEPSFGADSFSNESGFGNEPSFANEPPKFGEPSYAPAGGSPQGQGGYETGLDTSTQNQADLAAFMQQSEDYKRLEQERDSFRGLAERQKGEADELQTRIDESQGELDKLRAQVGTLRADLDELRGEQEAATSVVASPAELERVRVELAQSQGELEDLKAEIGDLKSELAGTKSSADGAKASAESAQAELSSLSQEIEVLRGDTSAADLERELESLRSDNSTLEQELAAAREAAAAPDIAAHARIDELQGQVDGKDRDVAALESEVDRLSAEMRDTEQHAADQSKVDGQKSKEETEALRRELERHKRLVEEFEKRNREVQADLETANDASGEAQQEIVDAETKRQELEAAFEALAADLETARTERDSTLAIIEEMKAAGSVSDLRHEIEGLKHRLKMEKERAGEGDARLTEEVDQLTARVDEMDAENTSLREAVEAAGGGATANDLELFREKVAALDRIVDSIVRTNLDPLSTVDRIRLQSAIRDTDPKATLAQLLDLSSPD